MSVFGADLSIKKTESAVQTSVNFRANVISATFK